MDPRIQTILQYAIMAPSGDNCQPWRFAVNDLNVDLFNDPERDSSLYNLNQRASLIANGAVLENIDLIAPTLGLSCACELFPNSNNPHHISRLSFSVCDKLPPSAQVEAIPTRHTNREKYQPVNITTTQIERWQQLPHSADQQVWVARQPEQISKLAALLAVNDRLVFSVPTLHNFLFHQIRWTDAEAQQTGDGLDIKTLGLNSMDKLAFHLLQHWKMVAALNKVGFAEIIQLKSKQLLKSASAIAIVTMNKADASDYVQGGQLWQRLLLHWASEGLTAQPIAGLACLMQAAHEGLLDGSVTPEQVQLLLKTRKELLQLAGANEEATILTMFRIGKGGKVVTALRRPLSEFIVM
jgi:hypothetical protein